MPLPPRALVPLLRSVPAWTLLALTALAWLLRRANVTERALNRALRRFEAARGEDGASFNWQDAVTLGVHWGSLAAMTVFLAALATLPWWRASGQPLASSEPVAPPPERKRWFIPAVCGVALLAVALRLPLAEKSLWWDEVWQLKEATAGEWAPDKQNPERLTFIPSTWAKAAWYFNKPTNHPVASLPSRACHLAWAKLTGAAPEEFSEIAVRLPVLLAGLAALALAAGLARELAGDAAGVFTALLMAAHPWLIRYGVDSRSAGMSVLFIALALRALRNATRPDARRPELWWWVFGLCQFLLMWAQVVAHTAVCALLFGAALWLILRGQSREKARLVAQLTVINLCAAALLALAYLPNLLQALTWNGRNDDGNLLTGAYLWKTLTQIAAGMETDSAGGLLPALPAPAALALLLAGAAAVATGFFHLRNTRPRAAVVLIAAPAGVVLFLAGVWLTDFYFYHRFIFAVSVPVILLAAVGLSRWRPRPVAWLTLATFGALTFPQTRLLLSRPYAPLRDVAEILKSRAEGRPSGAPAPILAACGLGANMVQAYDPAILDLRENAATELPALIQKARAENRELFVTFGYEALNRVNLPDAWRLLDDPGLFEEIDRRHGIEPEFTFRVLRLKPEA